jgi:uncharacterized damage-inducible protein DinB
MQIASSLSTRLQYQHKSLIELIDGLTDEQIRKQVVIGKWSIFENIVHLATYQHIFISRIKELLTGKNPAFPRYTAEADPLFLDNCHRSSSDVIHELFITRKGLASEILSFKESDYIKTAQHPVFGIMTLTQWLNFFLLHEAHHLFTIFKLAAELRKNNPV